ncbi:hypothetical protein D3C71_1198190 [compost metagenome]
MFAKAQIIQLGTATRPLPVACGKDGCIFRLTGFAPLELDPHLIGLDRFRLPTMTTQQILELPQSDGVTFVRIAQVQIKVDVVAFHRLADQQQTLDQAGFAR